MSELLNKSELNVLAGDLLLKEHHCSAPHAYYYACIQLGKHKICKSKHINISYEQQSQEIAKNRYNSHTYIIRKLTEAIRSVSTLECSSEFNRNIKKLKTFRELADYENTAVNKDECYKIKDIVAQVILELKKL